ncbi:MAG: type II toxin-antitoxin system HicA family toxin [Acidobacteriota bacterium]
MGRLRVLSGREACEIPSRRGFSLVRQRGSHAIMQARGASGSITVPVPLHPELRTGTLMAIIRQSGLPRTLFEA